MELIKSPWEQEFHNFGKIVRSNATIVVPFIGEEPLNELASEFSERNPPRVRLLTSLRNHSVIDGTVAVGAILDFCKTVGNVTVRNLPRLHAKVYIADDELAIITSGNLTQSSLNRNSEYGVRISEKSAISQLLVDIEEYWLHGEIVSLTELEKLADWQMSNRQKIQSSKYENMDLYKSQLQELENILRTISPKISTYEERFGLTSSVVDQLRGNPSETDNAVFSRTIVHILGYGPLSAREIDHAIQAIHPNRCDDTILNNKNTQPRWQHRSASARKWASIDLGKIEYDSKQKLWRLSI